MQFDQKKWNLERYPKTRNKSLRAWSAIDELFLTELKQYESRVKDIILYHDTYGALVCALNSYQPISIILLNSQLKAIKKNFEINKIHPQNIHWNHPLKINETTDLGLIKTPKSMALFEFYIKNVHQSSKADSIILCGFMTRNFTPKMIDIAEHYFEDVSQSKAKKKARLLILKRPKKNIQNQLNFHAIENDLGLTIKQYPGVFSNKKIDFGTLLLLESLPEINDYDTIMDLACGNGVIAAYIRKQNPKCSIHLIDDNFLAISSAKLNLTKVNTHFHWKDDLQIHTNERFDLIVCNPPFHFEFENTIEIALSLFKNAKKYLAKNGTLLIVANMHLNYTTHLIKLFNTVKTIKSNDKYEVISCCV
ncbi:MAG: methyltransferase [Bacteroidia bacterium]|nr:methyltransferase [Bacteroidia bacterium]